MNKKKGIIIGVLALMMTMMVGYAIFSETITINGTATAKGSFDLTYTCETDATTEGATGTCKIENDKIITTSTLSKPTDGVGYSVTITNNGTIPAVLKTVDSSNNVSGEDTDIAGDEIYLDKNTLLTAFYKVCKLDADGSPMCDSSTFTGDSESEQAKITLQPGEKMFIDVAHGWMDSADFNIEQPKLPEDGATINYDIVLGFKQVQTN